MSQLSLRSSFSAAHFYNQPRWSDEKNREQFGLCYSQYGHGHDYTLEITFAGEQENLLRNRERKQQILTDLTSRVDHQHLNFKIPEFIETIPTTENIAMYFWNQLKLSDVVRLRLFETSDLWVEIRVEVKK